jgi:predicted dienelactone hydrolase
MGLFKFTLAAAFCVMTPFAHAAGFQFISVPADGAGPMLHAAVWSPCLEPVGEVKLRRTTLPATENCPVSGEKLPLIVISHGYGGSFASHHDTAEALADAGFVVAAVSHPVISNEGDMSRADTLAAFTEPPADIKRLIDYMLGAWSDRAKLDPDKIGFFGFSRGGYAGLVVAGGNPDIGKAIAFCAAGPPKPMCGQIRNNETPTQALVHDPRVKAAVIADPAWGPLFDRDGLKDLKIPIQLWASEHSDDDFTGGEVTPGYVSSVEQDLPVKPDDHIVRDAGHFAFLPPCAPALAKGSPRVCTDRPGFDRAAFHKAFNANVLSFFRKRLVDADHS